MGASEFMENKLLKLYLQCIYCLIFALFKKMFYYENFQT